APLPPKSAPANGRSPDVSGSTSQRRVWPNRGAAEPDSHSYVNVLAVLHTRNRINEWLTKNVTPWPHEGLAFARDATRARDSRRAKSRIEAELGARFGERDHAVVIRDVVDAGRAMGDREQRGVCGSVDVQPRLAAGCCVPSAWSVQQAIAQH